MPFMLAVNQTVGIGLGTFVGLWGVIYVLVSTGRPAPLFQNSPFKTAVIGAMAAWCFAALIRMVLG